MWINSRPLILFMIVGIVVLVGCGAPESSAPSQATASEPGDTEPTPFPGVAPTFLAPDITPQPALPERRYLTLEFPPEIRAGDSDVIRLTLEADDLGNLTPTAEIGGNVVTGEMVEIPNLYESHLVIAEARFDIVGMEVRPTEIISEPLAQGNSATFYWSIRPQEVGVYRGTIWLYLRFVDKQSNEESQKTISAQIVEIEAVNFLGLSGEFARATGVVGSIVGTILGFPFIEDILKLLLKRRNK